MKKLVLTMACMIAVVSVFEQKCGRTFINLDDKQEDAVLVTATMYYPVVGQCDSTPYLTAGMYHISETNASAHKWIAMSRDLLKRWGGNFKYGDTVRISGAGHKDGVYTIVDTMNKRFKNRIDFLETPGTKPYKFKNVQITKS